jgi:hypothetical protein
MADDANTAATEAHPALLKGNKAVQERLLALAGSVRHEFLVFSPQLDARLFNVRELTQALTSFVARDRHNQVRILVEDSDQALRDNDRVVRLCQHMSDFVQMRRVDDDHVGLRELFVVIDRLGYLHQPDITNPECVSALADKRAAMPLAQRFYEMWERSQPLAAIRTTGL